MILEWLFRDLKSNSTTSRLKTKSLCVEYYLIEKTSCKLIDFSANSNHSLPEVTAVQHKLPPQLVVFIYKVSATYHDDNIPRLCIKHIIAKVTKNNLPFIFCLDYTNPNGSIKTITLMKRAATILRVTLADTHEIIVTDILFGKLHSFRQWQKL